MGLGEISPEIPTSSTCGNGRFVDPSPTRSELGQVMTASVAQVSSDYANSGSSSDIVCNAITVSTGSYLHALFTWEGATGTGLDTTTPCTSSPSLTWTLLDTGVDSGGQQFGHAVSSVTTAGSITVTGKLTDAAHTPTACIYRGGVVLEITGSSGYDTGKHVMYVETVGTASPTSTDLAVLSSQPALISGACDNMTGSSAAAADTGAGWTDGGTRFTFGTALLRLENKRVTSTAAVAATFTGGGTDRHISLAVAFLESVVAETKAPRSMLLGVG
jgi:hypothetical protein